VLRATTPAGDDVFGVTREPGTIEFDGQAWPLDFEVAADGAHSDCEGKFFLSDHGWTGVVADLLGPWQSKEEDRSSTGAVPLDEPRALGPFALDWRASEAPVRESDSLGGVQWRLTVRLYTLLGLPPDSLGNYLGSIGLFRLLSRKWPHVRAAWRGSTFCIVGGPATLDALLDHLRDVAETRRWTSYTRSWLAEQKRLRRWPRTDPLSAVRGIHSRLRGDGARWGDGLVSSLVEGADEESPALGSCEARTTHED
jgi:hypothetical protein